MPQILSYGDSNIFTRWHYLSKCLGVLVICFGLLPFSMRVEAATLSLTPVSDEPYQYWVSSDHIAVQFRKKVPGSSNYISVATVNHPDRNEVENNGAPFFDLYKYLYTQTLTPGDWMIVPYEIKYQWTSGALLPGEGEWDYYIQEDESEVEYLTVTPFPINLSWGSMIGSSKNLSFSFEDAQSLYGYDSSRIYFYYDLYKGDTFIERGSGPRYTTSLPANIVSSFDFDGLSSGTYTFRVSLLDEPEVYLESPTFTYNIPTITRTPTVEVTDNNTSVTSVYASWSSITHATYFDLEMKERNEGSDLWRRMYTKTTDRTPNRLGLNTGDYEFRVRGCSYTFDASCASWGATSSVAQVRETVGFTGPSSSVGGVFQLTFPEGSRASGGSLYPSKIVAKRDNVIQFTHTIDEGEIYYTVGVGSTGNWRFELYQKKVLCNAYSGNSCTSKGSENGPEFLVDTHDVSVSAVSAPSTVALGFFDSSGTATFRWPNVNNATRYEVQESVNGSSSWTTIETITDTSELLFGITRSAAALANGSYRYRVRACSSTSTTGGLCSDYVTSSNSLEVNKASFPSGYSGPSGPATSASSSVTVSWANINNAVNYHLYKRASGSSAWTHVTTTTSLSRSITLTDGNWEFSVFGCGNAYSYSWSCTANSAAGSVTQVRARPLSAPTSSQTTINTTGSSYTLNWTDVSSGYTVDGAYQSANSKGYSRSGDVGSDGQGDFSHSVKACNDYTWSCSTGTLGFNVTVRYIPVLAANNASIPQSDNSIVIEDTTNTIRWSAAQYATRYVLRPEHSSTGSNWTALNTVAISNCTSSTCSYSYNFANQGYYRFRISAYNEYDWSSVGSDYGGQVRVGSTPATPTINSASMQVEIPSASETTNYTLTWNNPSESGVEALTHNEVYIDTKTTAESTPSEPINSYIITGASNRDDHSYRIKACNIFGCSGLSNPISVQVRRIPSAVTILETNVDLQTTNGSVTISWCRSANLVTQSYQVRRNINGNSGWGDYNGSIAAVDAIESESNSSEVDYYLPLTLGVTTIIPYTDPREETCEGSFYSTNVTIDEGDDRATWHLAIEACNDFACSDNTAGYRVAEYREPPSAPRFNTGSNNATVIVNIRHPSAGSTHELTFDTASDYTYSVNGANSNGSYTVNTGDLNRGNHNYYLRVCNSFACTNGSNVMSLVVRYAPQVAISAAPIGNALPILITATPMLNRTQTTSGVTLSFDSILLDGDNLSASAGIGTNTRTFTVTNGSEGDLLSTAKSQYSLSTSISDDGIAETNQTATLPFVFIESDSLLDLSKEGNGLEVDNAPVSVEIDDEANVVKQKSLNATGAGQ